MKAFESGDSSSYYEKKDIALKAVEDSINKRITQDKISNNEIVPIKAPDSGNSPKGLKVGTYVDTGDGKILEIVGVGEDAFTQEMADLLGYNYNPNSGYWSYETDFISGAEPLKKEERV